MCMIMNASLIDVRALAIQTTSVLGGDREIPAWVLPGPRPTISTGRSMTDTGGTQPSHLTVPLGPIAVTTVGENWFVLTLATPRTICVVNNLCGGG